MTIPELLAENARRIVWLGQLRSEVQKIHRESKKTVNVYDFAWNKIGVCKDVEEASRIYELPVALVKRSMVRGGRIVSGLRFRVKKGA